MSLITQFVDGDGFLHLVYDQGTMWFSKFNSVFIDLNRIGFVFFSVLLNGTESSSTSTQFYLILLGFR